jgi:hypothetical protein
MDDSRSDSPHNERLLRTNEQYRTLRTLIRTCGWCVALFVFYKIVTALAGQTTNVSVVMRLVFVALADFKIAVMVGLTGLACAWAAIERLMRQRLASRLGSRNAELERMIDSNRTSSGLTAGGRTNPRDRRN